MQYRRLGATGLQVSALSYGAWLNFTDQVGRDEARNLVAAAWDHGVNFFDNAEVYGHGRAETLMGDVIADLRLPRDGYCVSSKVFFGSTADPRPTQRGLSRKHVRDACEAALRRLRVDYLDLYFCHRPDPDAPVEETVQAMDLLVRQGKVLYWGTSEWPAERIEQARAFARQAGCAGPSMEQPQYNFFHRARVEREYAALSAQGLGMTTWSPLASGLLSGKYADPAAQGGRLAQPGREWLREEVMGAPGERRQARTAAFVALARDLGQAPAPLAIAWCLRNPQVSSVILGASRVAQLIENLGALALVDKLDASGWAQVEAAFGD